MTKLNSLEESIKLLNKEFNTQLQAINAENSKEMKKMHDDMISLSSKHPDHAELLKFIVFVNDKLETKHTMMSDIVQDTINEMLRNKQVLVKEFIEQEGKESFITKFMKKIKAINYIKTIVGFIISVIIALGTILNSEFYLEYMKTDINDTNKPKTTKEKHAK